MAILQIFTPSNMSKTLQQYREVKQKIKDKKFSPVYLLHGEESFFTDQICDLLAQSVLPEAERSFNQFIFYGKEADASEIAATCKRYPMMSDHMVVIVKEAQQIKNTEALIPYLENPLQSTVFIFYSRGKKVAGNTRLFKAFKKFEIFTSETLYERDTLQWMKDHLKEQGFTADDQAIHLLYEYLGSDLSKIYNAFQQLMVNCQQQKKIGLQEIQDNIGIDRDYNVFELQKAIGLRQNEKALRIALQMGRNIKNNPFMLILGSLNSYYNRLLSFKSPGKGAPQGNPYMLRELEQAASKYQQREIEQAFKILTEYDLRFKGVDTIGMAEEDLLIEMTVKLMSPNAH